MSACRSCLPSAQCTACRFDGIAFEPGEHATLAGRQKPVLMAHATDRSSASRYVRRLEREAYRCDDAAQALEDLAHGGR